MRHLSVGEGGALGHVAVETLGQWARGALGCLSVGGLGRVSIGTLRADVFWSNCPLGTWGVRALRACPHI